MKGPVEEQRYDQSHAQNHEQGHEQRIELAYTRDPAVSGHDYARPGSPITAYSASLGASPLQLSALDNALLQFRRTVVERHAADWRLRTGQDADPHQVAATGVSGTAGQLPFLDTIQHAFGRHDVSNISAYTDQHAQQASQALGAQAYATGSSVAFGGAPDLHTAAHEAAHIVQQRGGVSLKGGVGQAGDTYEQHADRVADAVVSGRSAEGILDEMAGGHGGAGTPGIQRVPDYTIDRFEHENGRWTTQGRALTANERRTLSRALFDQARRQQGITGEQLRGYAQHTSTASEPLPPDQWQQQVPHPAAGRGAPSAEHEQRGVEGAFGDPHNLGEASPGEEIDGSRGMEVRQLDASANRPQSRQAELGPDQAAANVRMDEEVTAEPGNQVLQSGGFHSCTSVATEADGRRTLGHVSQDDQQGAMSHLTTTIVDQLEQNPSAINAHINTHPDARQEGTDGDEGHVFHDLPRNHTELTRDLRRRLRAELPATYRVQSAGDGLSVTRPDGGVTMVHVGVTERPADTDPTQVTSTSTALRQQAGNAPPVTMGHADAAREGHDEAPERIEHIATILEQRQREAEASGDERAATRARRSLEELHNGPATAEHADSVARWERISDEDIEQQRRSVPDAGSRREPNAPTTLHGQPGEHQETDVAPPPTNYDPAERERRAQADDDASAQVEGPPTEGTQQTSASRPAAAQTGGMGRGSVELERQEYDAAGHEADSQGASGELGADSGTLGVNANGASASGGLERLDDGARRQTGTLGGTVGGMGVRAGGTQTQGADGRTRGRSANLRLSQSGNSATLGAGYQAYANPPVHGADGRITVSWTIEITREFGAQWRIGGAASDTLTRTGTNVFVTSGNTHEALDANEREAQAFYDGFSTAAEGQIAELFRSANSSFADGAQGDGIEFWKEAPVGTARSIQSQSQVSVSLAVPLAELLEIGGSLKARWSDSAAISKVDDSHVDVTTVMLVARGGEGSAGTLLLTLRSGEEHSHRVTVTHHVDLALARGPLQALLNDGTPLVEQAPAVVRTAFGVVEGDRSTSRIDVAGALVREDHRLSEVTDENGQVTGYEGEAVHEQDFGGTRLQTGFVVDAPTGGGPLVVTYDVDGNGTRGTRAALGGAMGVREEGGDHIARNGGGTYRTTESFTQGQVENFCRWFVGDYETVHGPDGLDQDLANMHGTDAYGRLYVALRGERVESSQARARGVADFLQTLEMEGLNVMRSHSGGSSGRTLTRTDSEGVTDPNFMSAQERSTLRTRMESWEGRITAMEGAGGGRTWDGDDSEDRTGADEAINSTADAGAVRTEIGGELTRMRERRDAIDQPNGYGGVPDATQRDMVFEYERLIRQLEDLLARVDTATDNQVAGRYSEESQAAASDMGSVRQAALELQRDNTESRRFTVDHRRYFGQSETEGDHVGLGATARERTAALWVQEETLRREGEQALQIAQDVAGQMRQEGGGRLDGTAEATYEQARVEFDRARQCFEEQGEALRELNNLYGQLRRNERDATPEDDVGPAPPERDGPEPTDQILATHVETREEAGAAPPGRSLPSGTFMLRPAQVSDLVSVGRDGRARVRAGDIALENGLVARAIPNEDAEVRETRSSSGGFGVCLVMFRILEPARGGMTQLTTSHIGAAGVVPQNVQNERGAQFLATAVVE